MSFDFNLGLGLGPESRHTLDTLASTGRLPDDPFWQAVERRHDAHPRQFNQNHPLLGALVERQEHGDAFAPLFPDSPRWRAVEARHAAHTRAFDRYHPFLGRLLELPLPAHRGPSVGTPTPTLFTPGPGPGGHGAVPEPAGMVLMAVGLMTAFLFLQRNRKERPL